MSNEILAAETYIRQKLAGDAALTATGITGYFSEKAKNQQPDPYIVWTQRSAIDVAAMLSYRSHVEFVYLVRVISRIRAFSVLQPAADRIDADLHGEVINGVFRPARGVALGLAVESARDAPYSLVEDRGDVQWRHLGGSFRVWVSAS